MPRLHLFEMGDQPWCPRLLRDATTNLLELVLSRTNYYAAIAPQLAAAMNASGATDVVDLCSGRGGPWLRLLPQLGTAAPRQLLLTDKFPNSDTAGRSSARGATTVRYESRSIDASAVPKEYRGFRTIFTALHHFRPEAASEILADAVESRVGIAAFEFTERSAVALFGMLFTPGVVFVAVPFLRPFRWSTLFFTYVVPLIPLMALFDGVVSCLRTYSPAELEELVAPLRRDDYAWKIGKARSWRSVVPVTYVIGVPLGHQKTPGV